MCYVVTMSSLQDQLANTGRAKSQNVMPNGVGQGYLSPIIKTIDYLKDYPTLQENQDYTIVLDKKRIVLNDYLKRANNPAKYVNLKLFGLAVLHNFTMVGRKAMLGGDYTNFGTPCLVFIKDFTEATTATLYRTQQAESNFF